MSDERLFQREIKRSGYLRGTHMKKIRTRIVTGAILVTVGSYALAYFLWKPDKDRAYQRTLKARQWEEDKKRRLRETLKLKESLLARTEGKEE